MNPYRIEGVFRRSNNKSKRTQIEKLRSITILLTKTSLEASKSEVITANLNLITIH